MITIVNFKSPCSEAPTSSVDQASAKSWHCDPAQPGQLYNNNNNNNNGNNNNDNNNNDNKELTLWSSTTWSIEQ